MFGKLVPSNACGIRRQTAFPGNRQRGQAGQHGMLVFVTQNPQDRRPKRMNKDEKDKKGEEDKGGEEKKGEKEEKVEEDKAGDEAKKEPATAAAAIIAAPAPARQYSEDEIEAALALVALKKGESLK